MIQGVISRLTAEEAAPIAAKMADAWRANTSPELWDKQKAGISELIKIVTEARDEAAECSVIKEQNEFEVKTLAAAAKTPAPKAGGGRAKSAL